ncbi:MAG: hypothetical protein K2X39_10655 [Silvanigrellaceae bacterium]|nr:hypothetical protein [Silvanigrellaceae bacterium]
MQLQEIGKNYPAQLHQWPCQNPAKGLSVHIPHYLLGQAGKPLSSLDVSRRLLPQKNGFFARNYEQGDPLSALCKKQFVAAGKLWTSLDHHPGRLKAAVVFHNYENMTFSSEQSSGNKGQNAMAIIAILQKMHQHFMHYFKIFSCDEMAFLNHNNEFLKQLTKFDFIYLITDLLYFDSKHPQPEKHFISTITQNNLHNFTLFIIRDKEELSLKEKVFENSLIRYDNSKKIDKNDTRIADNTYYKNRDDQISFIENELKQINCPCFLASNETNVSDIIQFISGEMARKRSWQH